MVSRQKKESNDIKSFLTDHLFFQYTTAARQELEPEFNKTEFKAPMAGFGYGLPISRLVTLLLLELHCVFKLLTK